ncbi:MAG: DNA cytosine methyltransferase [Cyanobacteriota bacterium]|nr:DNA cytosine methyltransferase [Cyanobacteriota bacterium]
MKSLELFAGAGGLSLGIAQAGFDRELVIEINADACKTLRLNQQKLFPHAINPIYCGDVKSYNFSRIAAEIDLLAGGPPCQPFSNGGKHKGNSDRRDLFPQFIRALRELKPKAILIENVKGLLRKSFADYFNYLILQLTYPEFTIETDETWLEHFHRLQNYRIKGRKEGLAYQVSFRLLNAADYGIPQKRERVFIIGFRSDLNLKPLFPAPTHSQESLFYSKWVTEEYWLKHQMKKPEPSPKLASKIGKMQSLLFPPEAQRWLTVRDAIRDLPDPTLGEVDSIPNHLFVAGAKSYPGHTGSPLDEPAKTIKAGVHGVPGGENMMIIDGGKVRYFTVREAARLQTFPDSYLFEGSWTGIMRQLGNAVPVSLSKLLARQIQSSLKTVKAVEHF